MQFLIIIFPTRKPLIGKQIHFSGVIVPEIIENRQLLGRELDAFESCSDCIHPASSFGWVSLFSGSVF